MLVSLSSVTIPPGHMFDQIKFHILNKYAHVPLVYAHEILGQYNL